ncbi:unnamed protein product, partial [Symbiodinium sp. KB8]
MVFLPPTEIEERYSAEYNKQFKTVINGILSGLEGLFQDQSALCTAVRLVVVMVDRLQCDGVMIEKGDDIIVSFLLDLPDGLSSVSNLCEVKPEAVCLASDRLKEAMATALQEVNLTLKPDQTLVTLDCQIFGKEFIKAFRDFQARLLMEGGLAQAGVEGSDLAGHAVSEAAWRVMNKLSDELERRSCWPLLAVASESESCVIAGAKQEVVRAMTATAVDAARHRKLDLVLIAGLVPQTLFRGARALGFGLLAAAMPRSALLWCLWYALHHLRACARGEGAEESLCGDRFACEAPPRGAPGPRRPLTSGPLMIQMSKVQSVGRSHEVTADSQEVMDALELLANINSYRRSKGLEPGEISPALMAVAFAHVQDLNEFRRESGCNMHSWSSSFPDWRTGCCYTPDHSQADCMWSKGREITSCWPSPYRGNIY